MKCCTFLFGSILFLSLLILPDSITYSQLQGKDILKENYIIGESSELSRIQAQYNTPEFRIFDAEGNINENGMVETDKVLILDNEWQAFDDNSPVCLLSGDFDGDALRPGPCPPAND